MLIWSAYERMINTVKVPEEVELAKEADDEGCTGPLVSFFSISNGKIDLRDPSACSEASALQSEYVGTSDKRREWIFRCVLRFPTSAVSSNTLL